MLSSPSLVKRENSSHGSGKVLRLVGLPEFIARLPRAPRPGGTAIPCSNRANLQHCQEAARAVNASGVLRSEAVWRRHSGAGRSCLPAVSADQIEV